MLNHLRYGLIAATVLCSSMNIAMAEEMNRNLNITPNLSGTILDTLSCQTPQDVPYVLSNNGVKPVTLDSMMIEIDSNEAQAGFSFVHTDEDECETGMTLTSGASCNVNLTIQACNTGSIKGTMAVVAHVNGHVPTPKIAKTPIDLTVAQGNLAYVTNSGNNTVSICPVNADGNLGSCNAASTPVGAELAGPSSIVLNKAAGYAYIANLGSPLGGTTLSICQINDDGSLGSSANPCTNTTGNGSFMQPTGLAMNASGTMLYVTNGGPRSTNTVTACSLLADGSDLDTCDNVSVSSFIPADLAINQAETVAYVVSYPSTLSACDLNADGSIDNTNCTAYSANGTLNNAFGIALSQDGTMAYIGNVADKSSTCPGGPSLSVCPINADGTIDDSNCTATDASCTLTMPMGMTTTAGFAYVANSNPYVDSASTDYTVSVCAINADNSLGSCVNSDGGGSLNMPSDVAVMNFP